MIDLIIPMYNAEKTIGRLLGSLIGQTKSRKILVTIVDDWSTDNSIKEAERFKEFLPIRCVKSPVHYGKPGLVRQYGISITNCPYVMFADSDDMFSPLAAEMISRAILQNKPDVIFSNFRQENGEDEYKLIRYNSITWLHGNAYSRKFLEDNKIEFDDKFNEDGSFNLQCYYLSDKVYSLEEPMYYWMNNKESITRKNRNFLADIMDDYITTYSNAIKHILELKPELSKSDSFVNDCAKKFAEFLQLVDANIYYKGKVDSSTLDIIKDYLAALMNYNVCNKTFIRLANISFNNFSLFSDIVRQKLFLDYLDYLNIDYRGVFNVG